MLFDEKDRLAKVYIGAIRLRNVSSKETLEAMMSMSKAVIDVCIASIKSKKPRITEKELIEELNRICWGYHEGIQ